MRFLLITLTLITSMALCYAKDDTNNIKLSKVKASLTGKWLHLSGPNEKKTKQGTYWTFTSDNKLKVTNEKGFDGHYFLSESELGELWIMVIAYYDEDPIIMRLRMDKTRIFLDPIKSNRKNGIKVNPKEGFILQKSIAEH